MKSRKKIINSPILKDIRFRFLKNQNECGKFKKKPKTLLS